MAGKKSSKSILLKLSLLLFCFSLLSSALAIAPGENVGKGNQLQFRILEFFTVWLLRKLRKTGDGYSINGRVKIPIGLGAKGFGLPGKLSNVKVILNGGQRVTFLKPDGYFSFHNVPTGTHLIEVAANGYFFSPVRVDVSARNPGKVQAALTENRRVLTELVLEPLREEQYYEIREPFSIMSLVKSPMGLMMGFMLIMVFLMPKLVENMDPEEMKRAQEGVPSLANMLPGTARS